MTSRQRLSRVSCFFHEKIKSINKSYEYIQVFFVFSRYHTRYQVRNKRKERQRRRKPETINRLTEKGIGAGISYTGRNGRKSGRPYAISLLLGVIERHASCIMMIGQNQTSVAWAGRPPHPPVARIGVNGPCRGCNCHVALPLNFSPRHAISA